MATFDFKCDKCGFENEYNNADHLPKDMHVPEDNKCPNCEDGKLVKMFSTSKKRNFDIKGFCYENTLGLKAYKKNMNADDQAAVLRGEKNPY